MIFCSGVVITNNCYTQLYLFTFIYINLLVVVFDEKAVLFDKMNIIVIAPSTLKFDSFTDKTDAHTTNT